MTNDSGVISQSAPTKVDLISIIMRVAHFFNSGSCLLQSAFVHVSPKNTQRTIYEDDQEHSAYIRSIVASFHT